MRIYDYSVIRRGQVGLERSRVRISETVRQLCSDMRRIKQRMWGMISGFPMLQIVQHLVGEVATDTGPRFIKCRVEDRPQSLSRRDPTFPLCHCRGHALLATVA